MKSYYKSLKKTVIFLISGRFEISNLQSTQTIERQQRPKEQRRKWSIGHYKQCEISGRKESSTSNSSGSKASTASSAGK